MAIGAMVPIAITYYQTSGYNIFVVSLAAAIFILINFASFLIQARAMLRVDLDKCMIFMEIYRRGSIERVLKAHGPKANAAMILLAKGVLPSGAVPIRRDIIVVAIETLNLMGLEQLFLSRSGDAR